MMSLGLSPIEVVVLGLGWLVVLAAGLLIIAGLIFWIGTMCDAVYSTSKRAERIESKLNDFQKQFERFAESFDDKEEQQDGAEELAEQEGEAVE
jgi:hypothetical protein